VDVIIHIFKHLYLLVFINAILHVQTTEYKQITLLAIQRLSRAQTIKFMSNKLATTIVQQNAHRL